MEAEIALGDTMTRPAFLAPDGSLRRFHKVTANPMWNQKFPLATYEHDAHSRFGLGTPPTSSADWGWVQHMAASLQPGGKMAVVLDTGAVSRGSGNQGSNRERDIRKAFVERDMVEAVILLPENLFYNTTAPGIIMVARRGGGNPHPHQGQILLINASKECAKGRPKNYLTDAHIARIAEAYLHWREVEGLSKVIATDEAARNDYNLSPSRYVATDSREDVLPLEEALVLLAEAEEEQRSVDQELDKVLAQMGLRVQ
jgi:type I restriction enzyme M protein